MFTLQEVITAVKLKLHITVLVLNDNAYGVRRRTAPAHDGWDQAPLITSSTMFLPYWRKGSPQSHAPNAQDDDGKAQAARPDVKHIRGLVTSLSSEVWYFHSTTTTSQYN